MARLSARTLGSMIGSWRSGDVAYVALADTIRMLMGDGRIVPDTVLPAERELARELGVSRSTIASAYAELRATGNTRSVPGSGNRTLALPATRSSRPDLPGDALNLQQASPAAWPGLPGLFSEVAERAGEIVTASGYEMQGIAELRHAIADRYCADGLETDPDQILVTTGAQSAIALVARARSGPARRAMIETPTYPHAAEAFSRAGYRLLAVPVVVGEGWDVAQAEAVLREAKPSVAYLMPQYQNPTGEVMSDDTVQRISWSAVSAGTTVIVDETTADLEVVPGTRLPSFAARADPALDVITIGSLGKSIWGGLRIGWIRASAATITQLVAERAPSDLGTPNFEQFVATAALARFDEVLADRAARLTASQRRLRSALLEQIPEWDVPDPAGGVSLWVRLSAPRSTALVVAARKGNIYLSPGSRFAAGGGMESFLRIPTTAGEAHADTIAAALARAWRETESSRTLRDMAAVIDRPI